MAIAVVFGREWLSALLSGEDTFDPQRFGENSIVPIAIGTVLLLILAAMLASWYFTRFIIDEFELRVEKGAVFRQSKRIPFTKVQSVDVRQPFAARLFGLAELSIDAGSDGSTELRYLRRDDAYRFRDFLLVRAHGTPSVVDQTRVSGKVMSDIGEQDVVLVTVSPGRLTLAALLSPEIYVPVIVLVVVLVPSIPLGWWFLLPAFFIPYAFAAVGHLNKFLLTQFNYTLALSGPGLKISRGLTSLVSQSVPPRRIQGVKIVQSLLWRPFGLYRIEMDTLGAVHGSDEDGKPGNSILLPAGTAEQVSTVLTAIWPAANLDDVVLDRSPRRARWFRPVTADKLRYGGGSVVAVTQSGRLRTVKTIVPHRRVQSVRIAQGPLQRRLNLADVQLHTVGGIISMVARHLDPEDARAFAEHEVDDVRDAPSDGTLVETQLGAPDAGEALGWPHPADAPDPALGFPHLPWR